MDSLGLLGMGRETDGERAYRRRRRRLRLLLYLARTRGSLLLTLALA